ncbi:SH3 domain-containing protein 19 [Pseudorasbora parva]|uniref:SH3 domain-containing protein 19 n=1 Tax=Pseudorasbora parva TaxID=51549 RepID=UPI00351E7C5A
MAEARAEEDEERLREPGGGARRSAEHSDRNKPDQRHSSQGPLSSIRAVIKRTSRTSCQSDHQRERRRPQITILSAEPLPSNSWFPGASGGFPPAPPPAPPTWAAGATTVQLPPPSYEQVIREKSREQNLPSSSPSSSTPSSRLSTSTISTQTDTDSPGPRCSAARPVHKPPKPPRPSLPLQHTSEPDLKPRAFGDISPIGPAPSTKTSTQTDFDDISPIGPAPSAKTSTQTKFHDISPIGPALSTKTSTQTDFDDISPIGPAPSTKISTQTDFDDISPIGPTPSAKTSTQMDFDDIINDISPIGPAPSAKTSTQINFDYPMKEERSARPRPRPRSTVALQPVVLDQPMTKEVKVQTLVRLKDDGAESVFAGFDDAPSNVSSKYLQDLMEVFGSDETHGESQESKASDVDEAACSITAPEPSEPLRRPQPRPRTHKSKPQLAPKPSVFEVFDPTVEESPSKPLNPPVPAPRPLLSKLQSPPEESKSPASARPASAPPNQQMASGSSARRNSEDQAINTPVETTPVTTTDRNVGKRPLVPKHSRPPPPVLRKTAPPSQAAVDVIASVPSLPPRPSGGRLLPLRPPPIKVAKPAGSASSPAATNQPPSSRVSKRAPPLPPRPKPGHPLYERYSSKVQGDSEEKSKEEPLEETSFQEEQLIVLDDSPILQTPSNTLHDLCLSEVKGQDVPVSEVQLEDTDQSEQQIQQDRLVVARFAFEGEEGELTFSEGDVITLIEYVNEEWGRGLLSGRTGNFPLSFIQAKEETEALPGKPTLESPAPPAGGRSRGRALYDFSPECEDELRLKAGDIVCDLEDMDAEWFVGEADGKRGIVPKNYIQVLPEP